jgi:hypothetical protein
MRTKGKRDSLRREQWLSHLLNFPADPAFLGKPEPGKLTENLDLLQRRVAMLAGIPSRSDRAFQILLREGTIQSIVRFPVHHVENLQFRPFIYSAHHCTTQFLRKVTMSETTRL